MGERNKESSGFSEVRMTHPVCKGTQTDSPCLQRYSGPLHSLTSADRQLAASSHRISPFLHSHSLHRLWVNTSSPSTHCYQFYFFFDLFFEDG